MKKITKTLTQTLTGVGALLCLTTSRVLASALSVQEGADAARADVMPTELIGDNGVFNRLRHYASLWWTSLYSLWWRQQKGY